MASALLSSSSAALPSLSYGKRSTGQIPGSLATSFVQKSSSIRSSALFPSIKIKVALSSRVPTCRPLNVCMMAKREQLMEEIRKMSTEEIQENVIDLKGELFMMRAKKATRQGFKKSDYVWTRRKIARMLTVKREREIEKGIKPRESRKLDKIWRRNAPIRPPPSLAAILAEEKAKESKSER